MGMIDDQFKNHTLKVCIEQKQKLFEELLDSKEKVRSLEKLIKLNMIDLQDIMEQRDWYYERYIHYKSIGNI